MLCRKARADERPLTGLRIVHRELTIGLVERRDFRGGKIGALLAIIRILGRANARREPLAAFAVDERVMDTGMAVPNGFVAPIRRVPSSEIGRRRGLRIAVGMLHLRR